MSNKSREKKRKEKAKRKKQRNKDKINHSIAPMPPEFKKQILPYAVIKLLTNAEIQERYKLRDDLVCIRWNNEDEILHSEDFKMVKEVAQRIHKEQVVQKNLHNTLSTVPTALDLHYEAARHIRKMVDGESKGKKKLIFIKDQSGCGYWRMVVPARYMTTEEYYIDMAEIEVIYDYLLEYDVIVVQRLCRWSEYYTIIRLKRQNKRIVYDIDDNIFDVPLDNPAAYVIKKDQYEAARAIMSVCDVVTTTTEILKEQLKCPDKTIVVPNAIDFDDGYPAKYLGQPDNYKRILWMGSATHNQDWLQCADAVDRVMRERGDVRLVIIGSMPKTLEQYVGDPRRPWYKKRIEFEKFKHVETYVLTTKQLRANCGLAPLQESVFNSSKSNIKWLEYTGAGVPTIASNVSPYKEDIVHGTNGFLANTENEWYQAITNLLDAPDICTSVVSAAKKSIEQKFDIKQVIHKWEETILGE